jgi:hypothetical protein
MVQKEVKNKARIYGVVGILSAIVLVAMIYSYGAAPQMLSPTPSAAPSASPSEQTMETLPENTNVTPMRNFLSYEELREFITTNGNRGGIQPTWGTSMPQPSAAPSAASAPALESTTGDSSGSYQMGSSDQDKRHSITNIQVAGVDEADNIKTEVHTYML